MQKDEIIVQNHELLPSLKGGGVPVLRPKDSMM